MFGWLLPSPRCPVDTYEKAWTEARMLWLAGRLGPERLLTASVLLLDARSFPDPYRGTPQCAAALFDRLRGCVGVDAAAITLRVMPDEQFVRATKGASHDNPSLVRIAESHLADAEALVNYFVERLTYHMVEGMPLDEDDADGGAMADLVAVCLGLGVLVANAGLHGGSVYDPGWHWLGMSGLTSQVTGYALALFAFARGEERPAWAGALRPDAASALRGGLAYLRATKDTAFDLALVGAVQQRPRPEDIAERLSAGSPSARLASLWQVSRLGLFDEGYLGPVTARLADPDPVVVAEAAVVLAGFGRAAAPAVGDLVRALASDHANVRAATVWALGRLRLNAETVVPELSSLLPDRRAPLAAVAEALAAYAVPIDPTSARRLTGRLRSAVVDGDDSLIEVLARAMLWTVPAAHDRVREEFADDTQLCEAALQALADAEVPPRALAERRPEGITSPVSSPPRFE